MTSPPPPASSSAPPKPRTAPQPRVLAPSEVKTMLKNPEWWKNLKSNDIGVRMGPVLTEAQFKELQRRKRGGAEPIVIRHAPETKAPE